MSDNARQVLTVEERLANIETSVEEIKVAIVGNKDMGWIGLAHRVDRVEKKTDANRDKLIQYGAGVVVLSAVATLLINVLT